MVVETASTAEAMIGSIAICCGGFAIKGKGNNPGERVVWVGGVWKQDPHIHVYPGYLGLGAYKG